MTKDMSISEKEKELRNVDFNNREEYKYKIYTGHLQYNTFQDCEREQMVSLFQMAPMIKKTVPLEDADYILYSNPFARVEDFTQSVLDDLEDINKLRKPNSEIIICGKATNIKPYIEGKYENITYVPSHYAEYVAKRFDFDFKDEYVVYDDREDSLNIWPVDGCLNKCGFCRRCFMEIPFESQPLEFFKEKLDYFQKYHPEQMKYVNLRAENITQYGLDIYGKQMLHKVIELVGSYAEIKTINFSIGLCLGEMTDEIVAAMCNLKQSLAMALYPETGTDRLLKVIGKKHTCERAKQIIKTIKTYHPEAAIGLAIMIGLPTETLEDVMKLGDLILECDADQIQCNYYGYSPKHTLAKYEQLPPKIKELHLAYLINYIKKNYNKNYVTNFCHESFIDPSKRSVYRNLQKLEEDQKHHLARLLYSNTYVYFCGHNICVKSHQPYTSQEEFEKDFIKVILQRKRTQAKKLTKKSHQK